MNDSTSKITLIQSRLPYTDRRALSEAWFSALHLASDGAPARSVPDRRAVVARATSHAGARVTRDSLGRAAVAGPPAARGPRSEQRAIALDAPRSRASAPREALAARNAAIRPCSYPPFRTSLTIGDERGRVQLVLRRDGGTLHVVALCRPQVAETVRRALALAAVHLRARGERVSSSVAVRA